MPPEFNVLLDGASFQLQFLCFLVYVVVVRYFFPKWDLQGPQDPLFMVLVELFGSRHCFHLRDSKRTYLLGAVGGIIERGHPLRYALL